MAYTIALGDVLVVTSACANTNQVAFNTTFYHCTAIAAASQTDQAMVNYIDGIVAPLYKPCLGSNASFYGTRMARYAPGPTTLPVISNANTGIGTAATTCQAAQVSGIIKATCNFAGARFRARQFVPFPYLAATDPVNNVPTALYKTQIAGLGAQIYTPYTLITGLNSCTLSPVILHRDTGLTDLIVASSASSKWGTQVRRGNYGRPNVYPPF